MEQLKAAMTALEDPGLRQALEQELRMDDCEQKMFDLQKRIDALRPVNPKVHRAVKVGVVMDGIKHMATRRGPGRGGAR